MAIGALVGWTMAAALQVATAPPTADPALKLWRLDCGYLTDQPRRPLSHEQGDMPVSCYLIRHGDRYMLWDTGLSARAKEQPIPGYRLARTIAEQLAELNVRPEQIAFIGISHHHGDHTGQASRFPGATLIMGAADIARMRETPTSFGAAPTHLRPWLEGGSKLVPIREDHDVFGDGSVMVLMTTGHTPGHTTLLVKLKSRPVLLTGDLWSSHIAVMSDEMPPFSASFADTAASRERVRRIMRAEDARVILSHEPADIADLPPFPQGIE